ncbi:MAG: ABC transporter substrate-binding protein [Gammaproteobacteria bacterium]|nr:ABC transporter substrate-binding protein [Gammaproteobacteria bacterium]
MKRFNIHWKGLVAISIALLWTSIAFAATPSPVDQINAVTQEVLAQLNKNKVTIKNNPDVVYKIMNDYLTPHVDNDMMAKSVLGRAGWAKATPAQQTQFVALFSQLMTYTYSAALAKYDNQEIKYFPVRGGYEGKTMVTINSQVIQPDGPPLNVVYSLILHGNQWQVYDVTVEGVSLLESYRQQFTAMLNNQGMSALLDNLAKHNEAIRQQNEKNAKTSS